MNYSLLFLQLSLLLIASNCRHVENEADSFNMDQDVELGGEDPICAIDITSWPISSTSIHMNWTQPPHNPCGDVYYQQVSWMLADSFVPIVNVIVANDTTSYIITDLIPCRRYRCWVTYDTTGNDWGQFGNLAVKTDCHKP